METVRAVNHYYNYNPDDPVMIKILGRKDKTPLPPKKGKPCRHTVPKIKQSLLEQDFILNEVILDSDSLSLLSTVDVTCKNGHRMDRTVNQIMKKTRCYKCHSKSFERV